MTADTIYGAMEPSHGTTELLLESAPLMFEWSQSECVRKATGGMEEWAKTENTATSDALACDWYHGTWQLLRLLNMVAVPPWYSFYQGALVTALAATPQPRVLISACADYGMLATLHAAIVESKASPKIFVVDICETPLRACRWYAERFGLQIDCSRDNLLTSSALREHSFDVIVTDEFLTVIKNPDKPIIAQRWWQLLAPGGVLVTTAMIGRETTPELRGYYSEKARRAWEENSGLASRLRLGITELTQLCKRFAQFHNRFMISHESQIREVLKGFDFTLTPIVTPGECVNPTSSYQIVARAVEYA
jgi:2-polyprenyl-3-methyl-5-hydroxy-6-metoxy-1,4-benzoquinol methylase